MVEENKTVKKEYLDYFELKLIHIPVHILCVSLIIFLFINREPDAVKGILFYMLFFTLVFIRWRRDVKRESAKDKEIKDADAE